MGKFGFCKTHFLGESYTLDITVDDVALRQGEGITDGRPVTHWERFGSNKYSWDLVYIYYPDYTTGPDLYVFDSNMLTKTVGDIPANKRQKMNTWLNNHNYDTSWITLQTIIKDVLKDILHHLNERYGNADDIVKWIRHI